MRTLLLAFLVSASTVGAQAASKQADSLDSYNAEMSAESEELMQLQDAQSRLEAAGYEDIQLVTDVMVLRAKDAAGKSVVLLVDPETLANIATGAEPSTTGSGSFDIRRY